MVDDMERDSWEQLGWILLEYEHQKQPSFTKRVFIVQNKDIKETCSKSLSLLKRLCIAELWSSTMKSEGGREGIFSFCMTLAPPPFSLVHNQPHFSKGMHNAMSNRFVSDLQYVPQWVVIRKLQLVGNKKGIPIVVYMCLGYSPSNLKLRTPFTP